MNGNLVLHPVPADRGAALLDALKGFDDEFVTLLETEQRELRFSLPAPWLQ